MAGQQLREIPFHDLDPEVLRAFRDPSARLGNPTCVVLDAETSPVYVVLGFFPNNKLIAAVYCTRRSHRRYNEWAWIVAVIAPHPVLMTATMCKRLAAALSAYMRPFLVVRVLSTFGRLWPYIVGLPGAVHIAADPSSQDFCPGIVLTGLPRIRQPTLKLGGEPEAFEGIIRVHLKQPVQALDAGNEAAPNTFNGGTDSTTLIARRRCVIARMPRGGFEVRFDRPVAALNFCKRGWRDTWEGMDIHMELSLVRPRSPPLRSGNRLNKLDYFGLLACPSINYSPVTSVKGYGCAGSMLCFNGFRFPADCPPSRDVNGENARGYGIPQFRDFLLAAPARVREAARDTAAARLQRFWRSRSNDPGTPLGRRVVERRFHEMGLI
jgi:hypothetical protein